MNSLGSQPRSRGGVTASARNEHRAGAFRRILRPARSTGVEWKSPRLFIQPLKWFRWRLALRRLERHRMANMSAAREYVKRREAALLGVERRKMKVEFYAHSS
jgi:hypothetical protein